MAFAVPAMAQRQPAPALSENAKEVLGGYEFSNSERDRICGLTLKADPAAAGFKVDFDERCAAAFPLIADVTAWRLTDNDLLRLLDATGKPVVEFSEVEDGMYEAPTPGYGVLFLQSTASLTTPTTTTAQMEGEWSVQRGAKALCDVTMTKNELGDDSYALRVKPGCDPQVARFNPLSWRIDRGELVLTNKNGETWRFEEGENSAWRRIPVRNDGFALVKK